MVVQVISQIHGAVTTMAVVEAEPHRLHRTMVVAVAMVFHHLSLALQ
jgi:hypothetical protein